MGKATITYKEIRFTNLDGELTHCFVWLESGGDYPIGVQGWHHKAFPPSKSVKDILEAMAADDHPVMWPQMAPEE